MDSQRIPLFPLQVVLFPGMLLPLHIFEPRYREMIRVCLESDRIFGVSLIRSGEEVGEPAEPFLVGTTCEILRATPLDDGRLNLLTVGRRRFEILRLHHLAPYVEADVRMLDDPPTTEEAQDLANELRLATADLLTRLLRLQGDDEHQVQLPEDATSLSFALGAVLPAPMLVRQSLLELHDAAERLRRQRELVSAELERIKELETEGCVIARPFQFDPDDLSVN